MSGTYPEPDGMMTGGHSGGSTSHERAVREVQDGTLTGRLSGVREIAWAEGRRGITVSEVRHTLRLHHGQASSALSNLHRTGHLARLAERRNGCFVYVVPEQVCDRPTQEPGRVRGGQTTEHVVMHTSPALSPPEAAFVARIEREAGLNDGDPSALVLVEAGDLRTLIDLVRAATGSTPVGAS